MALVSFYFQLHPLYRLQPDREKFLWEEKIKEVFLNVAKMLLAVAKAFRGRN